MTSKKNSYICQPISKSFMYESVLNVFANNVSKFPDKEMQVCHSQNGSRYSMSFEKFDCLSDQFSRFLIKSGIGGGIVAILGTNSFNWTIAFLAAQKAGSVVMGINAGDKTGNDILDTLKKSGCKCLVIESEGNQLNYFKILVMKIKSECPNVLLINTGSNTIPDISLNFQDIYDMELEDIEFPYLSPDSDSCIFLTSGSTGNSKLVVWKHFQIVNLFLLHQYSSFDISFNDRPFGWLFGSPIMEIMSGWTRIFSLNCKSTNLSVEQTESLWNMLESEKCNRASLSHRIAIQLAEYSKKHNKIFRLKFLPISGQILDKNSSEFLLSNLCNVLLYIYGTTETAGVAINVIHGGNIQNMETGLVGGPFMSELRITNGEGQVVPQGITGNIEIRKQLRFSYYLGLTEQEEPDTFRENRWQHFGDLGYINNDDQLVIIGRTKYIINRGGVKVSPETIENAIMQFPGITAVLVVNVPDELYGEEICACYETQDNRDILVDVLREFCESFFEPISKITGAVYIPKYFLKMSPLPFFPNGKPDRQFTSEYARTNLQL